MFGVTNARGCVEAGVRVLLEDLDTGELIYCCHGRFP
jgi:hypothetical protein